MEDDNWSRQADEVEALSSIYGDEWCDDDPHERKYSIKITDGAEKPQHTVQLQVTFNEQYPSNAPPIYQLHAPWLRGEARRQLENRLQETYCENLGECIVYKWVENIREFLEAKASSCEPPSSAPADTDDADPATAKCSDKEDGRCDDEEDDEYGFDPEIHVNHAQDNLYTAAVDHEDGIPLPEIHHGEKVTDRKSVFMGHLAAVTHKQQVKMVLDSLKENRKIAAATHNIIAFRIDGGNGVWITGCEDDGEIHAGSRMLHLLDIMDARNVMVIVTRWYGGIHLGPDRFKHINNCTRDLLEAHGYIKDKGDKKGPKTSIATQQGRKKKR